MIRHAIALEPVPQEPGFSGFIQPAIGALWYKSNLVASFVSFDLSEEKIDSLSDEPDSQSTAVFLFPFELSYTFSRTRTQIFLGSQLEDFVSFDLSQQLGIKQELSGIGTIAGSFLFTSIPAKVWEDPYVTGQDREDTDRRSTGLRLTWADMLGSGLEVEYSYRNIDIDTERSGTSLGLPPEQQRLLDRNGQTHRINLLYEWQLSKAHRLRPAFAYMKDDRDGDARTRDVYDFQLSYFYISQPLSVVLNASLGFADYDERNPIFDKTQEDDRYSLGGTIFYRNPFGWKVLGSDQISFSLTLLYALNDTNIDFYDEEAFLSSVGVLYRF
ncbi:MAG TPA: DUF2860 family protein [Candidatus Entotheonella sp.]|jgi:hypothetical protein